MNLEKQISHIIDAYDQKHTFSNISFQDVLKEIYDGTLRFNFNEAKSVEIKESLVKFLEQDTLINLILETESLDFGIQLGEFDSGNIHIRNFLLDKKPATKKNVRRLNKSGIYFDDKGKLDYNYLFKYETKFGNSFMLYFILKDDVLIDYNQVNKYISTNINDYLNLPLVLVY